ncbi:hypothetical protein Plo01_54770 [Planobispora longispora]|uniref:Uncharacterized protein n=1 Tax=Planobispora longispora TaxID=28887 RepID=A0A8J3RVN0_9ACTN|nr:hypothetical protein GCM10020093_068830 [Planobispora longispora]GIH79048.1 hypothetical protein Plo01_54770 [Planobispora longispora]
MTAGAAETEHRVPGGMLGEAEQVHSPGGELHSLRTIKQADGGDGTRTSSAPGCADRGMATP